MPSSLLHTSSLARSLLTALYLVWVGSELWIRVSRPRPNGSASGQGTGPLLMAGIIIALIAASVLASSDVGPGIVAQSWPLFVFGAAVTLVGIALRVWSVLTLGRFFQLVVVIQDGHQVIRSGPYRLIRHPSYAGALLTMIGIGIALDNWLSLVVSIVIPLAAVMPRIVAEERALADGLGDEYRQYQLDTSRLVPGLW